jgi:HTH-type transcriptional regulator, sugar sensing transcriptional regulator
MFLLEPMCCFYDNNIYECPVEVSSLMSGKREDLPNVAESLRSLGLTKYEARVYGGLLTVTGATATEIHEICGVPRASVYPVMDRLLQKNLVSVSNTTPKRFNAVPPDEGVSTLMHAVEKDATYARRVLNELYQERMGFERGDEELIWSSFGLDNITKRLLDLITNARDAVQVISYGGFLSDDLLWGLKKRSREVSIEIISDQQVHSGPGTPMTVRTIRTGDESSGSIRLSGGVFLIDSRKVMVVMDQKDGIATGLYSESAGFVRFFKVYWDFFKEWAKFPVNNPESPS